MYFEQKKAEEVLLFKIEVTYFHPFSALNANFSHIFSKLFTSNCAKVEEGQGAGLLGVPRYHKNKRFSIIVEEELLR